MIQFNQSYIRLTPSQAIALAGGAGFLPWRDYAITFEDTEADTHTIYFRPSPAGLLLTGTLQHLNGESYAVNSFALVPTGGVYAADTVEVYDMLDGRGNHVTVDTATIDNYGYNPLWRFWWGNDRVANNTIVNSSVESSTGSYAPDGTFKGNTVTGGVVYLEVGPWPLPMTVSGLLLVDVTLCNIVNGTINLSADTTYNAAFTYDVTVAGARLDTGVITGVTNSTTYISNLVMPSGASIGINSCGATIGNAVFGVGATLSITGTSAVDELVTFSDNTLENVAVTANPPAGGSITHSNCILSGWGELTLDPDGGGETDLILTKRIFGGEAVYESTLEVQRDVTVLADFNASSFIMLDTAPRDKYVGKVNLTNLSSTGGGNTAILGIKLEDRPRDNRIVQVVAASNSLAGFPAHMHFGVQSAATAPCAAWKFLGATTSLDNGGNTSEYMVLRSRRRGTDTSAHWTMERYTTLN